MSPGIKAAYAVDKHVDTAVALCRQQLGAGTPDFLLVFGGGKHDPDELFHVLIEAFGNVSIAGGATAGAISTSGFGYTGYELGLIAFRGEDVTPKLVSVPMCLDGEFGAGQELGRLVNTVAESGAPVLLLFDSVAKIDPLRLHPASRIMAGFQNILDKRGFHVIGGGLLTDINMSDSWIFDGDKVAKNTVSAVIFPATLTATTVILHGCRPVSTFMEITRIEGAEVFELDRQPALGLVEQMLGFELGTKSGQELSLVATLGQKQGDPFAPYDESQYVNRLILQVTPERGSITLFEPDFAAGTQVQIMSRDNVLMLESVELGVQRLKKEVEGQSCAFGLYIDCAGRASIMSGAENEEASCVVDALAPDFPFLGFYSGVEVAPFAENYSRPLDWTGVLTIFQYRK